MVASRQSLLSFPLTRPLAVLLAALLSVAGLAGCGAQHPTSPRGAMPLSVHATPEDAGLRAGPGEAVHLEGTTGPGALYSLDKPADWNGDLVIYMHGYTDPAQPVALPANQATRDALLSAGFAVAASSFSENGYAVPEGMRQSHQLRGLFVSRIGNPRRTFLFGNSLGGIIAMLLTQKFPQSYDGTFISSGVVGGTRAEMEYLSDTKVLFDCLYPNVQLGGLFTPIPVTNLNAQVIGPVVAAVQANPTGLGVLNLATRHPLAGANGQEVLTSLINVLVFQMQGASDLLDRTQGHVFYENTDHVFGAGLPASISGPLNACVERYTATADAQAWTEHYGEPSGDLRIPVLTLHNTRDPVVPLFHEQLLADAVHARGRDAFLLQRQKNSYGHSAFTTAELLAGFLDLVHWVDTGVKPAP